MRLAGHHCQHLLCGKWLEANFLFSDNRAVQQWIGAVGFVAVEPRGGDAPREDCPARVALQSGTAIMSPLRAFVSPQNGAQEWGVYPAGPLLDGLIQYLNPRGAASPHIHILPGLAAALVLREEARGGGPVQNDISPSRYPT